MFVILLPSRMFCIGTLCTWLCACCATTTAWAPARTCWHWRPRIQSRRSAASGCISASARSVRQETADRICIDLLRRMLIAEPCRLTLFSRRPHPNRSRLSPSARCCRRRLTALWHQTRPEDEDDGQRSGWRTSRRLKNTSKWQWFPPFYLLSQRKTK